MSKGVYRITEEFEQALADYTGAPYVVTIDNACNALFLCLYYEKSTFKPFLMISGGTPGYVLAGILIVSVFNVLAIFFS